MGIVYTHGKHVAAFESPEGEPYYLGFERISLSNLSPRIPTWECSFMGGASAALQWIFRTAANCVTGQLKGAGSRVLKPENYIASWLRELANPSDYSESEIVISRSYDWNSDFYASTKARVKEILSSLEPEKGDGVFDRLDKGERVSLSIRNDIGLIHALYGCNGPLRPSQIISSHYPEREHNRRPELGYSPRKCMPSIDLGRTYRRIGSFAEDLFAQDDEGAWRHAGAPFQVMAEFVASLHAFEQREPGTFKHHIATHRECIEAANTLRSNNNVIQVEVDLATTRKSWEQSSVERVLGEYPHTMSGTIARLNVPLQKEDASRVIYATKATARWILTQPTH